MTPTQWIVYRDGRRWHVHALGLLDAVYAADFSEGTYRGDVTLSVPEGVTVEGPGWSNETLVDVPRVPAPASMRCVALVRSPSIRASARDKVLVVHECRGNNTLRVDVLSRLSLSLVIEAADVVAHVYAEAHAEKLERVDTYQSGAKQGRPRFRGCHTAEQRAEIQATWDRNQLRTQRRGEAGVLSMRFVEAVDGRIDLPPMESEGAIECIGECLDRLQRAARGLPWADETRLMQEVGRLREQVDAAALRLREAEGM